MNCWRLSQADKQQITPSPRLPGEGTLREPLGRTEYYSFIINEKLFFSDLQALAELDGVVGEPIQLLQRSYVGVITLGDVEEGIAALDLMVERSAFIFSQARSDLGLFFDDGNIELKLVESIGRFAGAGGSPRLLRFGDRSA